LAGITVAEGDGETEVVGPTGVLVALVGVPAPPPGVVLVNVPLLGGAV